MKIIPISPNANGGFPPIQSWDGGPIPSGYASVECDTAAFYTHNGFVTLTLDGDKVTAMSPNNPARAAWRASIPVPKPIKPTEVEQQRADIDYIAVMQGVTL